MPAQNILDDPGFILGLARHLERKRLECLATGLLQEAARMAEALFMVKLVLQEIKEAAPALYPSG